jgi:hypothetical protein
MLLNLLPGDNQTLFNSPKNSYKYSTSFIDMDLDLMTSCVDAVTAVSRLINIKWLRLNIGFNCQISTE